MSLNEAVALVAGASGDIGRAIAFDLLGAGAEVFMLGRSMARLVQPPPPENVREKCRFVVADLTDSDAVGRVSAEISSRSRLDVLVLSSGTYERSSETAVFARQIAANLVGPYALLQQLLPLLIEAKGQVVFINSTQALKATAGLGQYAATKHAMKAVADSLRDEVNAQRRARHVAFPWTNRKRAAAGDLCGGGTSIPAGAADPARRCRGTRSLPAAAAPHQRSDRCRAAPHAEDVMTASGCFEPVPAAGGSSLVYF